MNYSGKTIDTVLVSRGRSDGTRIYPLCAPPIPVVSTSAQGTAKEKTVMRRRYVVLLSDMASAGERSASDWNEGRQKETIKSSMGENPFSTNIHLSSAILLASRKALYRPLSRLSQRNLDIFFYKTRDFFFFFFFLFQQTELESMHMSSPVTAFIKCLSRVFFFDFSTSYDFLK